MCIKLKIFTCNIDYIKENEGERLVPFHPLVVNDADHESDGDSIGEAVPSERPPVEGHHLATESRPGKA